MSDNQRSSFSKLADDIDYTGDSVLSSLSVRELSRACWKAPQRTCLT